MQKNSKGATRMSWNVVVAEDVDEDVYRLADPLPQAGILAALTRAVGQFFSRFWRKMDLPTVNDLMLL